MENSPLSFGVAIALAFCLALLVPLIAYMLRFWCKYNPRFVVYHGWIPASWGYNREELMAMGVTGRIDYKGGHNHYGVGAFEYCVVTDGVLEFLISKGLPNPQSFVGIDTRTGEQVKLKHQKYWHYGN